MRNASNVNNVAWANLWAQFLPMASVRWRNDRNCWVACYSLPNGKRKQVSTGFTSKSKEYQNEALQIALRLEQAGNLAKRGLLTRQRVLSLLDEIAGAAGMRSLVNPSSTREFLDRFYAVNTKHVVAGTRKRYREYINQFLVGMGSAASRPMAFIDTAALAQWRDDRLVKGAAPATIKNQVVFLKSAFREALAQGVLIENPFVGLTPVKVNRNASVKVPFTREHLEALLRTNTAEWRILFLIGYYTGQRDRDCRELSRAAVDFEQSVIRFPRLKNRDLFAVPIHPRLERHLRWWFRRLKGSYVLPELSRLPQTGTAGFPHVFRMTILPAIGIEQPYIKGQPGRTQSKYSFHSFRHALSTALNEVGVSEVDRMALVGHSDKSINRGYTHVRIEHLRSELAKV